jgi:rubrerythrin
MGSGKETGDLLAVALEKEIKGRDFYRDAMQKSTNELGKELFRSLSVDESVHIDRIKKIYAALTGGQVWPTDWKSLHVENEDLNKLTRTRIEQFGKNMAPDMSDVEAINIGVQMEQTAIKFYEEQLEKAADPIEKEFATQMIAEERSHFAALESLKEFFSNPAGFYLELEKPALEG